MVTGIYHRWILLGLLYSQIWLRTFAESIESGLIPIESLCNELLDEGLKWSSLKYFCSYDPLDLPTVTQDDLNVSYALTISEIQILGLSHINRMADLNIQPYLEIRGQVGEDTRTESSYLISSILGIQDIRIHFRVELLKFLSLSIIDFIANGSVPEIDIPLQAQITPSERRLQFRNISIQHLDQLEIEIQGQNFVTQVGGLLPGVKTYIKNYIKDSIRTTLESKIGDGKTYINNFLSTFASLQSPPVQEITCPNVTVNGTRVTGNGTVSSINQASFALTIASGGNGSIFSEILVKYGPNRILGKLPLSNISNFWGHFDRNLQQFILHSGKDKVDKVLRYAIEDNVTNRDGSTSWPLIVIREGDILALYAKDKHSKERLKINSHIIRS